MTPGEVIVQELKEQNKIIKESCPVYTCGKNEPYYSMSCRDHENLKACDKLKAHKKELAQTRKMWNHVLDIGEYHLREKAISMLMENYILKKGVN